VALAQHLFAFAYMSDSLPLWLVQLRLVQGALVSPPGAADPALSLDPVVKVAL
jgi:hypothetical protein